MTVPESSCPSTVTLTVTVCSSAVFSGSKPTICAPERSTSEPAFPLAQTVLAVSMESRSSPAFISIVPGVSAMPVSASLTVTVIVLVKGPASPPSSVTVIVVVPTPTPSMEPRELTLAIFSSAD